jgi:hypothetical protein
MFLSSLLKFTLPSKLRFGIPYWQNGAWLLSGKFHFHITLPCKIFILWGRTPSDAELVSF